MNTSIAIAVAAGLVVAAVLLALGYAFLRKKVEHERKGIRAEADKAPADAKRTAETKVREADIEAKEEGPAAGPRVRQDRPGRRQEIAALRSGSSRGREPRP
jgi:hypothetical protein